MDEKLYRYGKIPTNIDVDDIFVEVEGRSTKIRYLKEGSVYIISKLTVDNYTVFKENDNGYIYLNDTILSRIIGDKRPVQIFKTLESQGIIEIVKHSKGHHSKGYRLKEMYNTGQYLKIEYSPRIQEKLREYYSKEEQDPLGINDEYQHLKQQFSKYELSINQVDSLQFVRSLGTKLFQKSIVLGEKVRGFCLVSTFNYIGRLISIIDDFNKDRSTGEVSSKNLRLTSKITSLPKILRPFVKINGMDIGETDICSSQPYILSTIINSDFTNITTDGYNLHTIYPELYLGLRNSKNMVPSNNLYNDVYLLGVWMTEKQSVGITRFTDYDFSTDFYNHILSEGKTNFPQIINSDKKFNEGRDYIKRHIMSYLFYKNETVREKDTVIELLKSVHPELTNFVERFFQSYGVSDFSLLLQRTESYLVLKTVTDKIHSDFAGTPFFTIHDSIITTVENVDMVRNVMIDCISEITGKTVEVKTKIYNKEPEITSQLVEDVWEKVKITTPKGYNRKKNSFLGENVRIGMETLLSEDDRVFCTKIINGINEQK